MDNKYTILTLLLIISSMLPMRGQSLPFACAGSMESYGVQGQPNSTFIWEIEGGTLVDTLYGLSNDTVVVRWDHDRSTHSIVVTEYTEFNCSGIPVGGSVEITAPLADIGDEEDVCQDQQFTFDATTSYNTDVSYLWPDSSTGNTYTSGTEGYVWVKITGTDKCYDYDSVFLTVNPLPEIDLGPDTTLCGTQSLSLFPGTFDSYEWSTGDIGHTITVDGERVEPELLWVEVTDQNGCIGSDTILLEVCDASLLFKGMPNTITPGDAGQNNEWVIPYIELFPDAVVEIFDRWGRLVYRTSDIANNPWDGRSMSGVELPMDAYYFVLDLKIPYVKPLTGYVNVIR